MEQEEQGSAAIEFRASGSRMTKVRAWMWVGVAGGVLLSVLQKGWTPGFLWVVGFVVLFVGVLDWQFLRKSGVGAKTVATLDDKGIAAENFSTKTKFFSWADIRDVSIQVQGGVRMLELLLMPHPRRKDKRAFLSGINAARPYININDLAQPDQERLFDEVTRRLRDHRHGAESALHALPANVLVEERLFRESLIAMAPRTWVTWGLVAANAAVWLALGLSGANILRTPADVLLAWGGNAASVVQQGQWWRLASAIFLHVGAVHLLMNMVGLVALGRVAERIYGHRLFLLIYLGAGVAGNAASLHFSAQKWVSVGASGAVYGIVGALLVAVYRHRDRLPTLGTRNAMGSFAFFVMYSLVQGFASPGIDNAAHICGLMAGMALALMLPTRIDPAHYARIARPRALMAAGFLAAVVAGVALTAPAAAIDQRAMAQATAELVRAFNAYSDLASDMVLDAAQVRAGKITKLARDEKGRTLYAPRMKQILEDLRSVKVPPGHPLAAAAADITAMGQLVHEGLAMQSNVVDGKTVPADPERLKVIEKEIKRLSEKIKRDASVSVNAGEKR